MEEHLNPLAATHLLQHTLRSFCIHQNSQWVYAVFWRILPRIFPPPKWDSQVGVHDRSGGNRRNWILAWEDGFCNFGASTAEMNSGESIYVNCDDRRYQGLKPEVFFKMSHEIHNYGEGLIGKVAADHSHKWIYKDQNDQEKNSSAWNNLLNSHPRTWEAQFQSGLETIALIAVTEGVLQLGAVHKISEEASDVVGMRKKFSYIETIPGFLLPYPSSSACPNFNIDASETMNFQNNSVFSDGICHINFPHHQPPMKLAPSMSSLEALLSKLPSVNQAPPPPAHFAAAVEVVEEEFEEEEGHGGDDGISGSVPPYNHHRPRSIFLSSSSSSRFNASENGGEFLNL